MFTTDNEMNEFRERESLLSRHIRRKNKTWI
jgi:hypothetical protein